MCDYDGDVPRVLYDDKRMNVMCNRNKNEEWCTKKYEWITEFLEKILTKEINETFFDPSIVAP